MIERTGSLFLTFSFVFVFSGLGFSQSEIQHWHHRGAKSEFGTGTDSDVWYRRPTPPVGAPVIVAILDSGVDTGHVDLRDHLWTNPGELPGNGKDDDGNGLVDDIYGWNFIGGPDGQSVIKESFEVTRVYARERAKWENVNPDALRGKRKAAYEAFLERKELVESKREAARQNLNEVELTRDLVLEAIEAARAVMGRDSLDVERLEQSADERAQMAAVIIRNIEEQGVPVPGLDWLEEIASEQFEMEALESQATLDYHYNPDYDSRKIVGDRYFDPSDNRYGNNQVDGTFSYHGTHVAGIVGAVRDNGIGMNGMADHVRLMALKIVPDGDERDKDVANAIRYAVDHGAQVINMSFGKGFSPEKELVDAAMKYAARKDVLLVVGAGNEGSNLDEEPKFPNDTYRKKPFLGPKRARNVLSVGALSPEAGENCIAEFSNYGATEVDVFAPGVYIYSTTPDGTYDFASGTSMAAPVVSGLAALIRSRYPTLSALQVKAIIMESCRPLPEQVIQPGTFELVSPDQLCLTGGMVDVPGAMRLGAKTKGKAKLKKRVFPTGSSAPAGGKAPPKA